MANSQEHECLSFGDALFLYLEREGMPLNVASVCIFEGSISREDCAAFVESKLPQIPRYRQRVVLPPLNIGLPIWEYDPEFDVGNHIHEVTLRRGSISDLKALAGKLLSVTMDRRRPLWDFTLVHGLQGNRTGLIVRVHHCMADGLSGVDLMNVMMDTSPAIPALPRKRVRFKVPKESRDPATLLLDGMVTSGFSAAQRLLTAQSELLTFAERALQAQANGASSADRQGLDRASALTDLGKLVPELASASPRLPFNVICRGPQQFRFADLPLAKIKTVKNAAGVTVNDVVLTVITAAIRRYAELHRVKTAGRLLRIIVPVSLRGKANAGELGNRITFLPVSVPLGIRDPRRLLAEVHERMALLKGAHVAELIGLAGTLLGLIPSAVQALLGPLASALPIPVGNVICTNVPGPQQTLYLLGHRLLSCYPYVPIGGEFGMNCAVLTYDGIAQFGFTGDVHAVPDLAVMETLLVKSFKELQKSIGIKAARSAVKKKASKRVPPATVAKPTGPTAPGPMESEAADSMELGTPARTANEQRSPDEEPAFQESELVEVG